MKKIIFLFLFLIIILSVYCLKQNLEPQKSSPEPKVEEVYGIDISHYQKTINWDQVSKSDKIIFYRRTKNNTSERVEKNPEFNFASLKLLRAKILLMENLKKILVVATNIKFQKQGIIILDLNRIQKNRLRISLIRYPNPKLIYPPPLI